MKEEKPQPTMQEIATALRDKFIEAAGKTANEVDMEAVTTEVIRDLNASKREVTLKLLGLDNRWGEWEVDSRKSPISDLLTAECKAMIIKWVNEVVTEVLTEEMRLKTKASIKKAFLKQISDLSNYRSREMITDSANSLIATLVGEVKHELEVELGIKE